MSENTYQHTATSRFQVASWKESAYVDVDGEGRTAGDIYYPNRGLTVAEVEFAYTGGIEARSSVRYLISYGPESAPVLGFEQVVGSVDGHDGSFVLQHLGSHDAASVTGHVRVVEGLGSGGLATLRGEADLRIAGHSEDGYELVLQYDL